MRYISASSRLNPEIAEWHHLYLARGRNLLNQIYADSTKAYHDLLQTRLAHEKKLH